MAGAKTYPWTQRDREDLQRLLQEGYSMRRCAEMLGISATAIRTEIKKSISEEHYSNRQYLKYDAKKAIDIQAEKYKKRLLEEQENEN